MAPALYLDENVDPQIGARLRADGFDVLTTQEAARRGADDEDQPAFAASVGRILFTHDMGDFSQIAIRWVSEGRHHAGIVYGRRRPAGQVCASFRHLFDLYTPDQLRDVTMGLPVAYWFLTIVNRPRYHP